MQWFIPIIFAIGTLISVLLGIWQHSPEWGNTSLVLGFAAAISALMCVAMIPWRK